jgi:hypothetical protein
VTTLTLAALLSLAQGDPKAPPPAAPQEGLKLLSKDKLGITIYGFLRLDMHYDTDRPNSIQIPQWILSKDLAGGEGEAAGENDFSMNPRLTRLGLDFDGPVIPDLWDVKITGKLEVDFYNLTTGNLSSNSREYLRLRHAWGKLDWGTFSLQFGQRDELFSPLTPTPNNDMVMWGAGNPGDRRPQLRPEWKPGGGFTITGSVGVTGAIDAQNLDGAAFGANASFFDGEASGAPTLQGRIAWETDGWVEKKKTSIGVHGHWAQEELDVALATGDRTFESDAVGVDLVIWLMERLSLRADLFYGRNLDDIRGGNNQGVNAATGNEIGAHGGWVELGVVLASWYNLILGGYLDNPHHKDLSAATARDKNLIFAVCNRFRWGPFEIGADYLNWTTEYFDDANIDDGKDHRFNVFFALYF